MNTINPASATPTRLPALPALLLAAGLAASLGCRREGITHFRVPKEVGASAPAPQEAPPSTPGGTGLHWTLPNGWSEEKGGGMRFATLKAPFSGKLDVSVTFLPGAAGGELANVNRWRGQIGLPAWDEAAMAQGRAAMKTKAGLVSAFDFRSEGPEKTRMLVGMLTTAGGDSWFLKMVGDEAPVAKARPDFLRILESLHLD